MCVHSTTTSLPLQNNASMMMIEKRAVCRQLKQLKIDLNVFVFVILLTPFCYFFLPTVSQTCLV